MKKIYYKIVTPFLLILLLCSCATRDPSGKAREAGKEFYRHSQYWLAVDEFSKAIKYNPDYWKLYYYRGLTHKELGNIDLAITDFNKVLEFIPQIETWYQKLSYSTWSEIYTIRGMLFNQKADYNSAISDFNRAVNIDNECKGAYYYRAMAKEAIGNYEGALEDYSIAIDLASKFMSGVPKRAKIQTYLYRANLYRKLNKLDLALADDNRAIEIEKTWEGFLSRGTTMAKLESFKQAIQDFDKAIHLNPSSATAYLYRASSRLLTDCDLNNILKDYYSVIDIKNIDPETLQQTYNQIAWVLGTAENDEIRNGKMAKSFALKSIRIGKDCLNLDTLAVAYAECEKYEEAITTIKEAIAFCESENPELKNQIEKHLHNFLRKKPIRENCPGFDTEMKQLRKWQNEF